MKYRLLCILILLPFLLPAQTSKENAVFLTKDSVQIGWVFSEKWRFIANDSAAYAKKEFDDSRWDTLSTEFIIDEEKSNPGQAYPGIGWFRYYLRVDSSMLHMPMNFLIKHNGASEIYLDGELIHKAGEISGKDKSVYKSPKNTIHILVFKDTGLHVLAVRYENYKANEFYKNYDEEYGGFVLSMEQANQNVPRQLLLNERITFYGMLIFGVFIALAFVHFLLFLFYRAAIYNLYFGLFNLSMALLSLAAYLRWNCEDPVMEMRASSSVFYIICLWCFSITAFINELFGKKRRRRFKIMTAICVIILTVKFFRPGLAYSLVPLYFVAVTMEAFVVIIKAMLRREPGAFIVGFGFLFLTIFLITIIVTAMFSGGDLNLNDLGIGKTFFIIAGVIAIISVPISISAYLPWKFAIVNKDLEKQLHQVKELSEKTLQQEKEKKQLLETQNERLEKEVVERTEEIRQEKKKSDDLLLNILPSEIAEELKLKGESKAHKYDEVSVLFTDFVNFTQISEQLGVDELLNELNINFTAFDRIMEKHGLEKIKTIGDAYLAVCGLPMENDRHAQNAVSAALDILEFVRKRKEEVPYGLDIRIGINSGSLIAGIIGVKKFAYDIWGDTVNTAARMEQSSEAGKINISAHTYRLVKDEFDCAYRGKIDAKGKGEMDMYFVLGVKG